MTWFSGKISDGFLFFMHFMFSEFFNDEPTKAESKLNPFHVKNVICLYLCFLTSGGASTKISLVFHYAK